MQIDKLRSRVARVDKGLFCKGVVTERDALALQWILEQGLMTVDQIFRAVYSGGKVSSPRYAYKRIQFLEGCNLLSSVVSPHSKYRFLKVTKSAQKLLLARGVPDVTRTLNVPSVCEIPHAEILTELRIEIMRSQKFKEGVRWWTGAGTLLEDKDFPNERFRDLMPDALWVTKSGTRVALEFERTRKGITRVRKKVEGLDIKLNRSDRAFDLVLWVAVDGAYRDLLNALGARQTQKLRSVSQFIQELRGEV